MKSQFTVRVPRGARKSTLQLLAATLFASFEIASVFAGDATAQAVPAKDVVQAPEDSNPLSFFDGKLVFDLEERLRYEARANNRDFDSSVHSITDGSWLEQRFRLGVTVQPDSWLKVYAQTQDSREFFSARQKIPGVNGAEGNDTFDLRQAYLQLGDLKQFPLELIVGRQAFDYGDRRLVGESLWNNVGGRTFDAVRLHFEEPRYWVDAFVSRPVQILNGEFDTGDPHDNFGGVYFSTDYVPKQRTELYFFYRDKDGDQPDLSPTNKINPAGASNGPAARFSTIGTRIKSNPGELNGWDYETEDAFEFGDVWATDLNSQRQTLQAFAAHVAGGYTFENTAWKPRIGLEYDYASGDHNPKDGSSESFQNLFPGNHEKYGFMDEFAWRNMHDARVQINFDPTGKLDLQIDYHAFWLADTHDYWYLSNGLSTLRTTKPDGRNVRTIGASSFAGQEIDLTASYKVTKYFKVQAGYSHFFAGTYLKDTGAHSDADFGYFMATLTF